MFRRFRLAIVMFGYASLQVPRVANVHIVIFATLYDVYVEHDETISCAGQIIARGLSQHHFAQMKRE